jgi:hypothetical protein
MTDRLNKMNMTVVSDTPKTAYLIVIGTPLEFSVVRNVF